MITQSYGEGIYFNMPFDEYKKLPYLSRSRAEKVLFDLEEAEYDLKNPTEPTSAMELGTAIHSAFLEPEEFKKLYIRHPNYADFYGKKILKDCEDLKEFLRPLGEKISGKKEELISRALARSDPEKTIIWDYEIEIFRTEAALNNQKILSNEDFEIIKGLRESLQKRDDVKKVISGGYSEVTIIWKDDETGVMCKCRLDYVSQQKIGEVKSFSVKTMRKSLFENLGREIINNSYNVQYVIYREALETIIKKIRCNQAKVYGDVDSAWLQEFLKNSKKDFFILFVRTAAPYQMRAIELRKSSVENATSNEYYSVARNIWRVAIAKFANAKATGIWREKEIETLEDFHVPGVAYQTSNY